MKIAVLTVAAALTFMPPIHAVDLTTTRPTRVAYYEKAIRGGANVPAGTQLAIDMYDSNLPNQVGKYQGHTITVPTVDLEPGPTTPPELLADPNGENEIVSSDIAALKRFFETTRPDPVGIIYCANNFGTTAQLRRSDILDFIALATDITRTRLVTVMESERMAPVGYEKPGFYLNGVVSGANVPNKIGIERTLPKTTQVVIFQNNPANAIQFLLGTGVKHILLVSSFADPADPVTVASFQKTFTDKKITLSVLSTDSTRHDFWIPGPVTAIMRVSFKPTDAIYAIVKSTGGTVYLNESATDKQPNPLKNEIILNSSR